MTADECLAELNRMARQHGARIYCVLWPTDGGKTETYQYFAVGTDAERRAEAEAFARTVPGARVKVY